MVVSSVIWLLMSFPSPYHSSAQHIHVVERFRSVEACQAMAKKIEEHKDATTKLVLRCISTPAAEVVKRPNEIAFSQPPDLPGFGSRGILVGNT